MKAMLNSQPCSLFIVETEIGDIGVASGEYGITRIILPRPDKSLIYEELSLAFPAGKWREISAYPKLANDFNLYAKGKVVSFADFELDLRDFTPFQRLVLETVRRIPYGSRLTYQQVAQEAGKPLAARAVGQVMARNPIPIIIPCHRVVASHGFGGFSAPDGLAIKKRLLALEEKRLHPEV
jgi:methylated-DNA-[protein]-cysteine S-methyltransferase